MPCASSRRPTAQRFVGAASFAALTGAPVLTDEFERDPARGAFPDQPRARARPAQPPRAGPQRRRLPDRAGEREHDRQAGPRPGRQPAHLRRAGRHLPGARRPGDEQPHVRARGDAGQPRAPARARRDRRRPRHRRAGLQARVGRSGAWPSRPTCCAAVEAVVPAGGAPLGRAEGPRHRRRHARADRLGALRRQPQLGPHGLRAGRGGRRARRRGDRRRRQRRASRARRACATSTSSPPPSCRRACEARVRRAPTCCSWPPRSPTTGRPPRPRPSSRRTSARNSSLALERTPDILSGARRHPPRRPDPRRLRRRARRGRGRLRARQARAQGPRRRRGQRHRARRTSASRASDNEVTIVTAAGERHVPRASKAEVARAILETVAGLRSGERTTA